MPMPIPPSDAKQHGLGKRLAGVGIADAGVREEHAQCGGSRHAAGEMPG